MSRIGSSRFLILLSFPFLEVKGISSQMVACPLALNGGRRARQDKERKYFELLSGHRCRLVVVALETGGRSSKEAVQFVDDLAALTIAEFSFRSKKKKKPVVLMANGKKGTTCWLAGAVRILMKRVKMLEASNSFKNVDRDA